MILGCDKNKWPWIKISFSQHSFLVQPACFHGPKSCSWSLIGFLEIIYGLGFILSSWNHISKINIYLRIFSFGRATLVLENSLFSS